MDKEEGKRCWASRRKFLKSNLNLDEKEVAVVFEIKKFEKLMKNQHFTNSMSHQ
jgi:hypothetical protein